jgi:hypothetical protein
MWFRQNEPIAPCSAPGDKGRLPENAMKPVSETDIMARAALTAALNDPRDSGLLFHGTAEPFDGPPKACGIDGLLWFADNPLFAQAYIPTAGLTAYVAKPSDWRMNDRVRPDKHSFWTEFATASLGRPLPDVEYDDFGAAKSWSIRSDWPTYAECVAALRGMGYSFIDGCEQVKYANGPCGPVARSDWMQPGRVFVTAADGLRLLDRSCGESDLTEKAHLDFDLFRSAEKSGFDGLVIDDFCQSSDCGNVGHRAVGLFAATVEKLEFVSYEAVHRPMSGLRTLRTPDFESFAADLGAPAPMRAAAIGR